MRNSSFQRRVADWFAACFPNELQGDREERTHRFLEEALELTQAMGCSREEAITLVEYVFSRQKGRIEQEVGGVMVTLASLCTACKIDLDHSANDELERNWSRIEAIRKKQASKPAGSPLPQ